MTEPITPHQDSERDGRITTPADASPAHSATGRVRPATWFSGGRRRPYDPACRTCSNASTVTLTWTGTGSACCRASPMAPTAGRRSTPSRTTSQARASTRSTSVRLLQDLGGENGGGEPVGGGTKRRPPPCAGNMAPWHVDLSITPRLAFLAHPQRAVAGGHAPRPKAGTTSVPPRQRRPPPRQ